MAASRRAWRKSPQLASCLLLKLLRGSLAWSNWLSQRSDTFYLGVVDRQWHPPEGRDQSPLLWMERRTRGRNERRLRNLASGPGDGSRCGGADRVVGERSVEAEFAHAWVGLAFAVEFLLEFLQRQIPLFAAEDVPAEEEFDGGAVMGQSPAIAMATHSFPLGAHHPGGAISCDGAW